MDAAVASSFASSNVNNALLRIPQLGDKNYRQWSFSMRFLLDGEDLWELVQPVLDAIVVDTPEKQKKKKKAAYLIYQSCSPHPQSHIAHLRDPAEMWQTLKRLYSRINNTGETLFEEFWAEKFQRYKSMDEYGAKLKNYQDLLAMTDQRLSESNLIFQLVKSLPASYDDVVSIIRMKQAKLTFHDALRLLIERERILVDRRQSKALYAGSGGRSRRGHFRNRHYSNRYQNNRQQQDSTSQDKQQDKHNNGNNRKPSRCTYCTRKGHTQDVCFLRQRAEKIVKSMANKDSQKEDPAMSRLQPLNPLLFSSPLCC